MNRDAHKKKGETAPRGTAKHATLGRRSAKIPTVPEADSLLLLIAKQVKELPDASGDLGRLGHKRGHWMWWAFPTGSGGNSEPLPRTRVPRRSRTSTCRARRSSGATSSSWRPTS